MNANFDASTKHFVPFKPMDFNKIKFVRTHFFEKYFQVDFFIAPYDKHILYKPNTEIVNILMKTFNHEFCKNKNDSYPIVFGHKRTNIEIINSRYIYINSIKIFYKDNWMSESDRIRHIKNRVYGCMDSIHIKFNVEMSNVEPLGGVELSQYTERCDQCMSYEDECNCNQTYFRNILI